jgi:hypothetical protein
VRADLSDCATALMMCVGRAAIGAKPATAATKARSAKIRSTIPMIKLERKHVCLSGSF